MNKLYPFRLGRTVLASFGCLYALFFPCSLQSIAQPADTSQPLNAECVGVTLEQIDTEKIIFALRIMVTVSQDLRLDQVTLANLQLNGLPVFAAPLQSQMHLIKGQKAEVPQPILLTIYFRDIDSTKPLSQAVQEGFATLDGEVYLSVHLSLIAKIVLRSQQAVVPMKLQTRVPVAIPGGAISKTVAVKVLDAADLALKHLDEGVLAAHGSWPGLRHDVFQEYAGSVFAVVVSYSVRDMDGRAIPLTWSGVAFRVSRTQIVLPYEALEPWSFDAEVATEIQRGTYKLEPAMFRLSLWPTGQPAPSPLNTDGGLQLGKQVQASESARQLSTQVMILRQSRSLQKGQLDVRASNANIAFLSTTETLSNIPEIRIAPEALSTQWNSVALLRFPRLGRGTVTPEVIVTSAYLDHGRIHLGVHLDVSVFGSPIIAPNGVIGMVQDESSGIAWSGIAENMKKSE